MRQRRRVGDGRAGGDGGQIVARHVGNDQGFDRRRRRELRQAPALDARKVFAQDVDVGDRRAARQQGAVDGLFVRKTDAGRRAQSRDEPPPDISATIHCRARALQDPIRLRRQKSGRVGNRMGGFDDRGVGAPWP